MVLSIGLAVLDNPASPESQQRTSWNTPLAEYKRLSFEPNKLPAHTFSYSPVGGTKTTETNHKDKRKVALKVHRSTNLSRTTLTNPRKLLKSHAKKKTRGKESDTKVHKNKVCINRGRRTQNQEERTLAENFNDRNGIHRADPNIKVYSSIRIISINIDIVGLGSEYIPHVKTGKLGKMHKPHAPTDTKNRKSEDSSHWQQLKQWQPNNDGC